MIKNIFLKFYLIVKHRACLEIEEYLTFKFAKKDSENET